MRNLHFQHVRDSWKTHSKFFLGKNRVMALALGRNESEEYSDKVRNFYDDFWNYVWIGILIIHNIITS